MQDRIIAFCPHCGNDVPQKVVHVQPATTTAKILSDGYYGEEAEEPVAYSTRVCETCGSVLLYCSDDVFIDEDGDVIFGDDPEQTYLVYPDPGELHYSVPEEIRDIYREAYRIKKIAPSAFTTQIRRALEALCEDRGARGGSLKDKLAHLVSSGEIPTNLAELTDVIRELGNIASHESHEKIRAWQAQTLDDFFRVLVEYIYVAPHKVQEFRDSLNKLRAKHAEELTSSVH